MVRYFRLDASPINVSLSQVKSDYLYYLKCDAKNCAKLSNLYNHMHIIIILTVKRFFSICFQWLTLLSFPRSQ